VGGSPGIYGARCSIDCLEGGVGDRGLGIKVRGGYPEAPGKPWASPREFGWGDGPARE